MKREGRVRGSAAEVGHNHRGAAIQDHQHVNKVYVHSISAPANVHSISAPANVHSISAPANVHPITANVHPISSLEKVHPVSAPADSEYVMFRRSVDWIAGTEENVKRRQGASEEVSEVLEHLEREYNDILGLERGGQKICIEGIYEIGLMNSDHKKVVNHNRSYSEIPREKNEIRDEMKTPSVTMHEGRPGITREHKVTMHEGRPGITREHKRSTSDVVGGQPGRHPLQEKTGREHFDRSLSNLSEEISASRQNLSDAILIMAEASKAAQEKTAESGGGKKRKEGKKGSSPSWPGIMNKISSAFQVSRKSTSPTGDKQRWTTSGGGATTSGGGATTSEGGESVMTTTPTTPTATTNHLKSSIKQSTVRSVAPQTSPASYSEGLSSADLQRNIQFLLDASKVGQFVSVLINN